MKILNLIESRRNQAHPSQQRQPPDKLFDKYRSMSDEDISDMYVSFTEIDKLGINPQSSYNTPIGIYTYPMKYVLKHRTSRDLPFAGDRKNIWVVRSTVSELFLEDYDSLERDIRKIKDYLTDSMKLEDSEANGIINDAIKSATFSNNLDASRMWNIARKVAKLMDNRSKSTRKETNYDKKGHDTVYFNTVLRKVLGYRAIVDNGLGIIHSNEPNQAVFLDTSSFEVVEKIAQNVMALTSYEQNTVEELLNDENIVVLSVRPVIRAFDINQTIGQKSYFQSVLISRTTDSRISDTIAADSVAMYLYGGIITGHRKNFEKFKSFVRSNKEAFVRAIESEAPYYIYEALEKVAGREGINEDDPDSIRIALLKDLKTNKFGKILSRMVAFILDLLGESLLNKMVDEAVESYMIRNK